MPEKDTLNANEFAIQDAATFSFNPAGTSVKIDNTGSVTVTLNYKLDDPTNTLQKGPGTITLQGTCGVFNTLMADHFKSSTQTKELSLAAPSGSSQVLMGFAGGDFILLTDGQKGRQGNTVADDMKDEAGKEIKK